MSYEERRENQFGHYFFGLFMTRRLVLEFDILELGDQGLVFMDYMFFKARVYADPSPLSAEMASASVTEAKRRCEVPNENRRHVSATASYPMWRKSQHLSQPCHSRAIRSGELCDRSLLCCHWYVCGSCKQ